MSESVRPIRSMQVAQGTPGAASAGPAQARQARKAAEGLVSQLFFAPLLAEMRQTPFGKKFGGGGRGEEVFGEQLDLRLADRVAAGDSSGVVSHLTKKLTRSAGTERANTQGSALDNEIRA